MAGDGEPVLEGIVVAGDRRGRELGFPTANVEVHDGPVPPDGVYAGWCELQDGSRHVAAVSVGMRPTFYSDEGARLVEAYLLDFSGDLYGQRVRVGVVSAVRSQARFEGADELVAQMGRDVMAVRAVMSAGAGADGAEEGAS